MGPQALIGMPVVCFLLWKSPGRTMEATVTGLNSPTSAMPVKAPASSESRESRRSSTLRSTRLRCLPGRRRNRRRRTAGREGAGEPGRTVGCCEHRVGLQIGCGRKFERCEQAHSATQSAAQSARGGATFVPGTPEALFQTHIAPGTFKPNYDVARDGRFLIDTELDDTSTEPIHLLLNWRPPAK